MPKSLVTGAAGFIGSHVVRHLRNAGHEVIAVDDLSGGYEHNVPQGVEFVQWDVTDADLMSKLFDAKGFDYVFHLAAYAAEGLSHFIRRFNYTNNVIGSVNLINEAVKHDVKRFVFTSSMAVYGSNQVPMVENMKPAPEDPYGISKYAVEMDLAAAREMFGLDFTVFRPHNVYGERQNIGDRYRNVIAIFINQLMHGEPMTVFGDGEQTRAFSYIDDVAPIIASCIEFPDSVAGTFNIGADQHFTLNELAVAVARAFGVEPEVVHLPARTEVKHAWSSHRRLRAVFGERATVDLEVGLGRMVEWAKQQGPTPTPQFLGIELSKNLPPTWTS